MALQLCVILTHPHAMAPTAANRFADNGECVCGDVEGL